jgi:hypothetical protein
VSKERVEDDMKDITFAPPIPIAGRKNSKRNAVKRSEVERRDWDVITSLSPDLDFGFGTLFEPLLPLDMEDLLWRDRESQAEELLQEKAEDSMLDSPLQFPFISDADPVIGSDDSSEPPRKISDDSPY